MCLEMCLSRLEPKFLNDVVYGIAIARKNYKIPTLSNNIKSLDEKVVKALQLF